MNQTKIRSLVDGNQGDQVKKFPTLHIAKEDIVDTNGAGDAFVGGFLAHLATKTKDDVKDMDEAIRFGLNVAAEILKVTGCDEKLLKIGL